MAEDAREWEHGWEGHERAQRKRMAELSLIDKLEWLEEAQRVVEHLVRGRRDSGARGHGGGDVGPCLLGDL